MFIARNERTEDKGVQGNADVSTKTKGSRVPGARAILSAGHGCSGGHRGTLKVEVLVREEHLAVWNPQDGTRRTGFIPATICAQESGDLWKLDWSDGRVRSELGAC